MRNLRFILAVVLIGSMLPAFPAKAGLDEDWAKPPIPARARAYWWWLNGNVTAESITHDLEQMKAKGFGGAVIYDANGAEQEGNAPVPHGPTFFSPAWRKLYRHALTEANRLGLEMSLNIQSGWNLGGPVVTADDAVKKYVWMETNVLGGLPLQMRLRHPQERDHFYRDTFVVAFPYRRDANARPPLSNWKQKALQEELRPFSAPDSSSLFVELPSTPGEEDTRTNLVMDLTDKLGTDGVLRWTPPPGRWEIFRFGYTLADHCMVSTASEGWNGYALDVYDAGAFNRYWDKIVEPLIADAGPLVGKTLKYLQTDSWEIELANWTPTLRAEFRKRRGYDMVPWLPALTGRIVNNRNETDRFLADYRRTLGDLAIDNHYRIYRDRAHAHGLLIHPESGGPHAVPIDAQQCLGWDDAPMSEFWAWSWEHRIGDDNRFFVKQPASAAHTCGRKLVLAEGFTEVGLHWQESLWSNLKPTFDKAICEGLNGLVWHAFVCSPKETGIPGQQYFAGTHLNPKVTWWGKSAAFFAYIDRCQAMMQEGLPFADVLYYYGDHVPNFAQLKSSDPAKILPGYDYDVISEEALLARTSVRNGRIVLPDGMSYRALVLPPRDVISLPALQKVKELADAGATIIGTRPTEASGLTDYPESDAQVKTLAHELFDTGRVIMDRSARDVLKAKGIGPDFAWVATAPSKRKPEIDYIHRTADGADIYFVANRGSNTVTLDATFRIGDRAPELWDALSGKKRFAATYSVKDGRMTVPLRFGPCGSWLVVFREPLASHPATGRPNWSEPVLVNEIYGPWTVNFDPHWGGPPVLQMDNLRSWTTSDQAGVKYYSGTASYHNTFNWPGRSTATVWLDLGNVRELAEVKVNGKSCGVTWAPPFRVDITKALVQGDNKLDIEVVNFWPNRIIGDQFLPPNERRTRTNIRKLTKSSPLVESGLLGPVRLLSDY